MRGSIIIKASLFFLLVFCLLTAHGQAEGIFKTISPRQAADLISQKKGDNGFVILDVRTTAEFETGHLHNAILLDYYSKDFISELDRLDKTKTYLIYCRSGNRSGKTLRLIEEMGFKQVYDMAQGIIGWRKNEFPVTQ
jgi:rhodanese-related sulfurtransferase